MEPNNNNSAPDQVVSATSELVTNPASGVKSAILSVVVIALAALAFGGYFYFLQPPVTPVVTPPAATSTPTIATSTDVIVGGKSYKNQDYGVSFKYPEEWSLEEEKSGETTTRINLGPKNLKFPTEEGGLVSPVLVKLLKGERAANPLEGIFLRPGEKEQTLTTQHNLTFHYLTSPTEMIVPTYYLPISGRDGPLALTLTVFSGPGFDESAVPEILESIELDRSIVIPTSPPQPLKLYRNDLYGFAFGYPNDWVVTEKDDLNTFTVGISNPFAQFFTLDNHAEIPPIKFVVYKNKDVPTVLREVNPGGWWVTSNVISGLYFQIYNDDYYLDLSTSTQPQALVIYQNSRHYEVADRGEFMNIIGSISKW